MIFKRRDKLLELLILSLAWYMYCEPLHMQTILLLLHFTSLSLLLLLLRPSSSCCPSALPLQLLAPYPPLL